MKIKVDTEYLEGTGDIVKGIKVDCNVCESLTLTQALRRLSEDKEVGEQNRKDAFELHRQFIDAFTKEE